MGNSINKKENELQIFNNDEFGQVEVILNDDNEPEFELYSVGMSLGYLTSNGYAYKTRIDTIAKNAEIEPFSQGVKKYLSEEMLYDFIIEAKTSKSRPFRKWVTNEVLPTLRKTGKYELHNDKEEKQTELQKIANNVFGEINTKIENSLDDLSQYYRPTHKNKLNFNKFIKSCLLDNATKENCKLAKETFLTLLGGYSIYEEVPIEILRDKNTIPKLYDICKNINNSIVGGIQ